MAYALTTCEYKVENQEPVIYIFARDDCKNKKVFKVKGFRPYYYYKDPFGEHPVRGLNGSRTTKKFTKLPNDVRRERERHHSTYESDILFPIRFMVDRGIRYGLDIKDGKVVPAEFMGSVIRPLFLDIEVEVDDINVFPEPRVAKWPLICVTVFCPIDGNIVPWRFEITNEQEERDFLELFIKLVEEFDPDLITGYNVFFDMCTVVKRMMHYALPHYKLSPMGKVRIDERYDEIQISGRYVFDYHMAYKKYKAKVLPSWKLEPVALTECDIPESNFPLDKMNCDNIDDVADYNLLDVYRLMAMEEKLNILHFYDDLRAIVGCSFREVLEASKYVDVLMLRYAKDKFLLPRKTKGRKRQKYVGAVVLPPETGVHRNVAFLDFTKMYPSILMSYNISPETLRLIKPVEPHYTLPIGLKFDEKDPETGKKVVRVEWKDVYYLKKPKGLLPRVAEDLIRLRDNVIKRMLKQKRGSTAYWNLWWRQYSLKFVLNALYGVFAYPKFRLFIPQISASMTGQGRKLTMRTIEFLETLGYSAMYGDTDGLYFETGKNADPVKTGLMLRDEVNKFWEREKETYGLYMAPSVKLEYVFESLLLAAKKHYSAMVIYDNGEETRELKIVGFEPRRSDSTLFTRVLQRELFTRIHAFVPTEEVVNFVVSEADKVKSATLHDIGVPLPLRTPLKAMKAVARVKSIVYANEFLDQKIDTGSRTYEYYVKLETLDKDAKKEFGFKYKPILPDGLPPKFKLRTWSPKAQTYVIKEYIADRIAFNGVPPEEWRPYIDMNIMVEKIVWNKVDTILSALGVTEEERIKLYGSKKPIKKKKEE